MSLILFNFNVRYQDSIESKTILGFKTYTSLQIIINKSKMSDSFLDDLELVTETQPDPESFTLQNSYDNNKKSYQSNKQCLQETRTSVSLISSKPSRVVFNNLKQSIKKSNNFSSDVGAFISNRQEPSSRVSLQNHRTSNLNQIPKSTSYCRKLGKGDTFVCRCCIDGQQQQCQFCKGKHMFDGKDNLIKFFEYVMEFKLGLKQSYQQQQLPRIREVPNAHCNMYFSSMLERESQPVNGIRQSYQPNVINSSIQGCSTILSKNQLAQKLTNFEQVHYGYCCDNCQIDPIKGPRYHCDYEQCEQLDLCQNCYVRVGHRHQMKRIQTKNKQVTNINKMSELINRTSGTKNLLGRNSIRRSNASKSYSSAIH